jgi:hypothetical protein
VDGKETFNGEFISKPNPPFRDKDCAPAECAAGWIVWGNNPQPTSPFLNGGGGQVSGFTPAPFAPWLGVGGGLNHSYGSSTAIEGGISIPPGYGVSPAGYSTEFQKGSRQ